MSNKINDIPDIPKFPNQLKEAINNNNLVIFIGAGVSRLVGCDGWDVLAEKLVEKCDGKIRPITKELLLQQNDNIKLISICNNILDDDDFMEVMKKSLKHNEAVDIESDKFKIYKDLKQLGDIFVTTNADRIIDEIFTGSNISFNEFKANEIKRHNTSPQNL